MLVVIGIIGVLVGILLPVLGGARKQARLVACTVHLRSIGQACASHMATKDGYLPLAGRVDMAGVGPSNLYMGLSDPEMTRYTYAPIDSINLNLVPFIAALAPHLGVTDLPRDNWQKLDIALNAKDGVWRRFMCPDTDSVDRVNGALPGEMQGQGVMMICAYNGRTYSVWATNSDYLINEGVFGFHSDPRYERNRMRGQSSKLSHPETTMLFADGLPRATAADPLMNLGWITLAPSLNGTGPATMADALQGTARASGPDNFDLLRHNKRVNILFADGHVETRAITPDALMDVYLIPPR